MRVVLTNEYLFVAVRARFLGTGRTGASFSSCSCPVLASLVPQVSLGPLSLAWCDCPTLGDVSSKGQRWHFLVLAPSGWFPCILAPR